MEETKWALFKDYKWKVMPVVKQTAKTTTVLDGTRERRCNSVDAISDSAEVLRAAAERLTSSDALMQDECHKASVRNSERNATIIASLA